MVKFNTKWKHLFGCNIRTNIYRNTPLAFLKTTVQKTSLGPLCVGRFLSQPECGMTTTFTSTVKASSIIGLFRSGQEERFHRIPVTSSLTSLKAVFRRSLTKAGIPVAFLMARLFSSLALPYERFLRAPHAFRCTSGTSLLTSSTKAGIPPRAL